MYELVKNVTIVRASTSKDVLCIQKYPGKIYLTRVVQLGAGD